MSIYLIDYENTNVSGLDGLLEKTKDDTIIIFYNKHCNKLTFSLHEQIQKTNAKVQFMENENHTKNGLDFNISSYLGYLISQNSNQNFIIVSKDCGFKGLIDFWDKMDISVSVSTNLLTDVKLIKQVEVITKKDDIVTIKPQQKAQQIKKDITIEKIQKKIPQYQKELDQIFNIVNNNTTKLSVNNALAKVYGSRKAGAIYKEIKPLLVNK